MKIAIWGAGNFGQYIGKQLLENKEIEVVCFIDKKKYGEKVLGIDVMKPDELLLNNVRDIDIVLVAFMNGVDLYDELHLYENYKFGIVKNFVFVERLQLETELLKDKNIFWVEDKTKPLLPTLETNIVDFCNLNCKGCSHFSNLYKKGDMVTFENFREDLLQIACNIHVYRLNLLGGEALLNNRLIEYMEYARRIMPMTDIWVITNGLLLLKQKEDFFRCCIDNNVGIDISEYEPTSLIIDDIIKLLDKYGVRYNVRNNKGDFGKNIDMSGSADRVEAMQRCRENKCHFFREGKIYKCPFAALGNKFFMHYNLDIRLNEGTDIYDENLDWKELVHRLICEPVEACKYCGEEVRFAWEVSNRPSMDEWIVN